MAEENLKSMAVKGVGWSMAERYSGQLVEFGISLILARILTPGEYGLIGMLAIFIGISNVFIDGGFSSALVQCKNRTQRDISTVFFINTTMALTIYAILFLAAPWIAEFYNQPLLTKIVRVYCLTLIISSLASTSRTILVIDLDFKTTTKISLFSGIVSGICGVILAFTGFGVWALVWQSVLSATLYCAATFFFVRWYPRYGFSRESFRRLFGFSSKLFAATIISAVYDNIFGAVIGKKFNSATLGFYNRAVGFNALLNSNVTSVLSRVSYPLLSRIQDEDERLIGIYQKYIQMSAFFTFPILMLLCGIAKPLILFLLTDKWSGAIAMTQILAFAYMWDGVVVSNLNLIKVKGRSDLVLKLEVVKKSIAFSILGIAILMNSVLAICVGRAVYGLVALYLNTYYTKKLLNYGFFAQIRSYWPYLALSMVVLAEGLLVSHFVSHPFWALCAAVPLCLGTYLFCCHRFRLYAYTEAVKIIHPMLNKFGCKRSHKKTC